MQKREVDLLMQAYSKVATAEEAVGLVQDGSVLAVSGFNMANTPEYLLVELYGRYARTGHPSRLFLMTDALPATPGRGFDYIAGKMLEEGNSTFIRGLLVPFLGFAPKLQVLVKNDALEAYAWPIGITAYWFREIASGRPGLITRIGLKTLMDPRQEGGCLNPSGCSKKTCRTEIVRLENEEYLFYKAPKPQFAFVRATDSDEMGNLSMADEGIRGSVLSIAQATKAQPHPGSVVAQVRWITKTGTINTRDVDVPGPLVDRVVVSPAKYHWQAASYEFDPRLSYKVMPPSSAVAISVGRDGTAAVAEQIVARRVLLELVNVLERKGSPVLVSLGIGMPAYVSSIAAEESVSEWIVTVLESGPWGGIALPGMDFGLAIGPFALSTIPDMFTNFEGGIVDAASLGFLQIDKEGNVNPAVLPGRMLGPGGFPVIAGGAPRTFFGGSFTAGNPEFDIADGKLVIRKDGDIKKFVERVHSVFFSGPQALMYNKPALFITERAVFRLEKEGLVLTEVAPGVDVERDVLARMEFQPKISKKVATMDARIFRKGLMGVRETVEAALRK